MLSVYGFCLFPLLENLSTLRFWSISAQPSLIISHSQSTSFLSQANKYDAARVISIALYEHIHLST